MNFQIQPDQSPRPLPGPRRHRNALRFWSEARVPEFFTQALKNLSAIKPSVARHSLQSPVTLRYRHGCGQLNSRIHIYQPIMWTHLPSPQPYEAERRQWLEKANEKARPKVLDHTFSSHTLLLLIDIELAFCAGAWLSVIVMSTSAIEAMYRQVVVKNYASNAEKLFGDDAELQWLRSIRNEITHAAEPGTPSQIWKMPSDNLVNCHGALEDEAKRAVALAYRVTYLTSSAAK